LELIYFDLVELLELFLVFQ